jgi:hypothetical protein
MARHPTHDIFPAVVGKFVVAAAMVFACGCAQPGGSNVGGGGEDAGGAPPDLSQSAPDMTPSCGDKVCSPSESCMSCFADCGMCNCPAGFADCDGQPQNGCETQLNSIDNCGGCGMKCAQTGGTNKCVLVGATYQCQPTCDATHADCDHNGANGCETDLTSPQSCGGCGMACQNPNGGKTCVAQGATHVCQPTCTPGFAACGAPQAGCTTNTSNSPDNCGSCGRTCSGNNVATRNCVGGACAPSCQAPFSDCNHPAADDGCETNGTADPGEPDNTCTGQSTSTGENSTTTYSGSRILPAGDADTWTIQLNEGSHVCFPGTSQNYWAVISLSAPEGNLTMNFKSSSITSCDNTWGNQSTSICTHWTGTCSLTDNLTTYVQVVGANGAASSCNNYTLSVHYCSEGDHCGCP